MQINSLDAETSPESVESCLGFDQSWKRRPFLLLRQGPVGKSGQCQSVHRKARSVYPWVVLNIVSPGVYTTVPLPHRELQRIQTQLLESGFPHPPVALPQTQALPGHSIGTGRRFASKSSTWNQH